MLWDGGWGTHLQVQILTVLSLPPVTKRRWPPAPAPETTLPGCVAGAQDTALQPITCAEKSLVSQVPSSLNSRTETLPSLLAQARTAPTSWGAHWTELTICSGLAGEGGGGQRGWYRRRGGWRARRACSRPRDALARLSLCRRRRRWRGCFRI